MGKKITVSLSIILICSFTFINGYTYVYPSYADSNTDNWTSVTTNQELAEAFRYYCKSRNLAIEGSVLDALTTFTTNNFNTICNTLGIDVTALQAHLKRSTDSNGRVQFLFDQFGVTAFNRIFAEFLQNNNLEVGDSADEQNNTIYNGYSYVDDDGNFCLIWIIKSLISSSGVTSDSNFNSNIVYKGTYLKYQPYEIYTAVNNNSPTTFRINANSNTYSFISYLVNGTASERNDYNYLNYIFYANNASDGSYTEINGYGAPIAYMLESDLTRIRIGIVHYAKYKSSNTQYYAYRFDYIQNRNITNNGSPVVIFLTTNNNTINNNTYTDNRQTVINNQGDVYNYNYDDDDPPVNPPSGGGTVTPPSDSGGPDGDISFPDFNFQLPQINWSLGDLSEKFPFSIPFDLIAFFTVLNAEPQAPSIDANIPLGSWYTWHFQADFSQFNNWATIIRNVEFIAFCIGLIYLTIRLVKG